MRRPAARATQSVAPPPSQPRRGRPPKLQAAKGESLELAVSVDREQRKMIDEFGELSRQLEMYAPIIARHEVLKKAIKSWFDSAPSDADATVEGSTYLLQISARERERHVRDPHAVIDRIGLERFLAIATVPVTALQRLMGTVEIDALLVETRSGSRRIRCIPKFPAVPPR